MKRKNRLEYNSLITNIEQVNPSFSKAKAYVMYHGLNRNNTYFTKQAVESKLYTLKNIPIVGEYIEDKDNFGTHGGKIEISDEGIKYIETTKPYGVIPESAKFYWETVQEADGKTREYLVVDGIFLWTGRYSEVAQLKDFKFGQSMEIDVIKGEYKVIDGQETFDIEDFNFSALCILGISKSIQNLEDHVEPCFESSSIMAYTKKLSSESFALEYVRMMNELKSVYEVVKPLDKFKEILEKYSITEEELASVKGFSEELSVEEVEALFTQPEQNEDNEEPETEEEPQEPEADEPVSEDSEGDDGNEETYTKEQYEELVASLNSTKQELEDLKNSYAEIQSQLDEYKNINHKNDVEKLVGSEEFSILEKDEVFAEIGDINKLTIEEIKVKLYALVGKKVVSKGKAQFNFGNEPKTNQRGYEDIFAKYANK